MDFKKKYLKYKFKYDELLKKYDSEEEKEEKEVKEVKEEKKKEEKKSSDGLLDDFMNVIESFFGSFSDDDKEDTEEIKLMKSKIKELKKEKSEINDNLNKFNENYKLINKLTNSFNEISKTNKSLEFVDEQFNQKISLIQNTLKTISDIVKPYKYNIEQLISEKKIQISKLNDSIKEAK